MLCTHLLANTHMWAIKSSDFYPPRKMSAKTVRDAFMKIVSTWIGGLFQMPFCMWVGSIASQKSYETTSNFRKSILQSDFKHFSVHFQHNFNTFSVFFIQFLAVFTYLSYYEQFCFLWNSSKFVQKVSKITFKIPSK